MAKRTAKPSAERPIFSNCRSLSTTKVFAGISKEGFEENPMFRFNYRDDVVFEVVSCYNGSLGLGLRVNAPLWEPNLELKFYCAGYGKKPDENYKRGLAEAIDANSSVAKSLFSMKPGSIPARWLEPLAEKDMGDGLSLIEKFYVRHLPKDYQGWGVNLKQREGRVGCAIRDEIWIEKLGGVKDEIQRTECKRQKVKGEPEDTEEDA